MGTYEMAVRKFELTGDVNGSGSYRKSNGLSFDVDSFSKIGHTHVVSEITDINDLIKLLSENNAFKDIFLTGEPKATTPVVNDRSLRIANTSFVYDALESYTAIFARSADLKQVAYTSHYSDLNIDNGGVPTLTKLSDTDVDKYSNNNFIFNTDIEGSATYAKTVKVTEQAGISTKDKYVWFTDEHVDSTNGIDRANLVVSPKLTYNDKTNTLKVSNIEGNKFSGTAYKATYDDDEGTGRLQNIRSTYIKSFTVADHPNTSYYSVSKYGTSYPVNITITKGDDTYATRTINVYDSQYPEFDDNDTNKTNYTGELAFTDTTYGLISYNFFKKLKGIDNYANHYVLPAATSSVLGGIKVDTDIFTYNSGKLSLNKDNISKILGYEPVSPDTIGADFYNSGKATLVNWTLDLIEEIKTDLAEGSITIKQQVETATKNVKGIVQIGNNIKVSDGTIFLDSTCITNALGYTPVSATNMSNATYTTKGIVSVAQDKLTVTNGVLSLTATNISNVLGYTPVSSTGYATASTYGVVKVGNNINVSNGVISITKDNINNALGITDITANATYTSKGIVQVDSSKLTVTNGVLSLTATNVNNALGYTPVSPTTYSTTSTYGVVKAGNNVSISNGVINVTSGNVISALGYTPVSPTTYSTATNYGVIKVGSNISVSNGVISLNKANITSALGYEPTNPDTIKITKTAIELGLTNADKTINAIEGKFVKTASYDNVGVVKADVNTITLNSDGELSLNLSNISSALGYTPVSPTKYASNLEAGLIKVGSGLAISNGVLNVADIDFSNNEGLKTAINVYLENEAADLYVKRQNAVIENTLNFARNGEINVSRALVAEIDDEPTIDIIENNGYIAANTNSTKGFNDLNKTYNIERINISTDSINSYNITVKEYQPYTISGSDKIISENNVFEEQSTTNIDLNLNPLGFINFNKLILDFTTDDNGTATITVQKNIDIVRKNRASTIDNEYFKPVFVPIAVFIYDENNKLCINPMVESDITTDDMNFTTLTINAPMKCSGKIILI